MRSAMGGWVAKRFFTRPKGLAIIMEDTGSMRGSRPMGTWEIPDSNLLRALARASGSFVRTAPSWSASYSRVRETANWVRLAASGARMASRSRAITLPPSSRSRRPPPNHSAMVDIEEMMPAMPAATEPVRMSRL